MIYRDKTEKLNGLFPKCYIRLQSLLRSERGQTLIEYSLLLGISSAISSFIAIFRNQSVIVIAIIIVLFIFLLFWKPKVLATIVVIALLLSVLLFIYRWVEYGHI
jgi:hypothetical protein